MTTYPYTYLASFMSPGFQQMVVARALRQAATAGGPDKQRLEQAARTAGLAAPGFRPGKIPLQQLTRPLITPISKTSPVSPFTGTEEIAAPVFRLWLASQPELREQVAAFLTAKELPVSDSLPAEGLPETMTTAEMDALVKEMGVADEGEQYDNTALMLVCLTARAPVYEEDAAASTEDAPAVPESDSGAGA